MSQRSHDWDELADDERHALADGYGCGLCLDLGHLNNLGPCPRCRPDGHAEHLLDAATGQVASTWAEEHDDWQVVA